ncbi:MAG: hypothetical protein U0T83_08020 [Bacteriovoracaceae bacterium]
MNKLNYLVIVPLTKNQLIYQNNRIITIPIINKAKINSTLKNFILEKKLKLKSSFKKLPIKTINGSDYHAITFLTNPTKNKSLSCKRIEKISVEFLAPYDQILCESIAIFNLPFNSYRKKVFFYGGSFNPLHKGHIECVRQFPFKKDLVVVPDYNPFKMKPKFRNIFQNYQSLLKAFSKFNVSIYSGFYGLTKPNPTYIWLKKIKAGKIGLVMGDDNFLTIEKWYKANHLLKKIESLYVIPRVYNIHDILAHKAQLTLKFTRLKIFILKEHSYQNLSSTAIRKKKL